MVRKFRKIKKFSFHYFLLHSNLPPCNIFKITSSKIFYLSLSIRIANIPSVRKNWHSHKIYNKLTGNFLHFQFWISALSSHFIPTHVNLSFYIHFAFYYLHISLDHLDYLWKNVKHTFSAKLLSSPMLAYVFTNVKLLLPFLIPMEVFCQNLFMVNLIYCFWD